MIRTQKITATLAGANGSAVGNALTPQVLSGRLVAVYIDVTTGSQPNTTDVTVTTSGNNSPAQTLLVVADVAANAWYYPQRLGSLSTDGTATTGWFTEFPIDDYIKAAGAQGNAGVLNVYVLVDTD